MRIEKTLTKATTVKIDCVKIEINKVLVQLQLSIVSHSRNVCRGKFITIPIMTTITLSLNAAFSVLFILVSYVLNFYTAISWSLVCEGYSGSIGNNL